MALKPYKLQNSADEKSVVFTIVVTQPQSLLLVLRKTKKDFLRYIGYLNFTYGHTCTITELSNYKHHASLLSKCIELSIVKNYERSGKNVFLSIKYPGEVLNKLKYRGFRAANLSTYDSSTLYTTLPHNLIKLI